MGQVVQLGVARRGQKHTAAVTIGGVGEAAPAGKLRPQLGMAVQWGDDPRGGRKNACKVIKVWPAVPLAGGGGRTQTPNPDQFRRFVGGGGEWTS